ncbi:MAG: redox-regulated ATPase YchF [Candidatus Aenigmarchaeota archaeon]|nr:redox-regulated ATPase YchF [Candidatus Aenigmarchaeota archaeon]
MLGIVGKSNTGKSTFFKAATLIDVEISNRIFTTIKPNVGIAYVTAQCPCKELDIKCNPNNSKCISGTRFIPIQLTDIAGLVPDAHNGRGLGNQFLSDIMSASALINVIDISGSTDDDGNPVPVGSHDPISDVLMLEKELDYWLLGLIKKDWNAAKSQHNTIELFSKRLSGLGISKNDVKLAMEHLKLSEKIETWSEQDALSFVTILRKQAKPSVIAANKIDIGGKDNFDELQKVFPEKTTLPTSAEIELALREAAKHEIINYIPGDSGFSVSNENALTEKQIAALAVIKNFLSIHKSTNVQEVLNTAAFRVLNMIAVFPVENESKLSNKKGNVLPDCFLMKKGATALDLAYQVHEEIGRKFISALNARTRRNVSADYELQHGDIISIKAGR